MRKKKKRGRLKESKKIRRPQKGAKDGRTNVFEKLKPIRRNDVARNCGTQHETFQYCEEVRRQRGLERGIQSPEKFGNLHLTS
jgi:hypothetical protein